MGSTPSRASVRSIRRVVLLTAACKAVAIKLWGGRRKVQLLHHSISFWPRRLLTRTPATRWYGTRIGIAVRLRVGCLWVRLPPVLLGKKTDFAVPWSNGNDTSLTKRKRGFESLRDDSSLWSASAPAAFLFCKEGDRVRFSGEPFSTCSIQGAAGPTERRLACNQEIRVRLPGGPHGF